MYICMRIYVLMQQEILVDDSLSTDTIKNFIDGSLEKLEELRCVYLCMCVCVCLCVCACECVCVCMCVHVYVCV